MEEVVIELDELDIDCSQSNLSRIELEQSTVRADIIAGLCIIYKMDPRDVLFRNYKVIWWIIDGIKFENVNQTLVSHIAITNFFWLGIYSPT